MVNYVLYKNIENIVRTRKCIYVYPKECIELRGYIITTVVCMKEIGTSFNFEACVAESEYIYGDNL